MCVIASQAHRASLCTSNPSQQQASCQAQQHLSTPEQYHCVFLLCPKPPPMSQQLAQVVAGLQAPVDGQARRLPMGNQSERVRLPSGFNALHPACLSFSLAQRALSWSNHSTGQAPAQQDLTRWGLRLGWSQRLSVTHPKESGVHGSGWRLPSGVLRAQLTVPLGAGSCTNTGGEYSSPVWLETLTWTESLGHGGYQDSPHSRPLCTMQACTGHCCLQHLCSCLSADQKHTSAQQSILSQPALRQQSCVTQQCTLLAQHTDIRNTCTHMQTSLYLRKFSGGQG